MPVVVTGGYVITRSSADDSYGVWRFDPESAELLSAVPLDAQAAYDRTRSLIWIGNYLLDWSAAQNAVDSPFYEYRLFGFDAGSM